MSANPNIHGVLPDLAPARRLLEVARTLGGHRASLSWPFRLANGKIPRKSHFGRVKETVIAGDNWHP